MLTTSIAINECLVLYLCQNYIHQLFNVDISLFSCAFTY